jgi:hypothetical protein
MKNWSVETVVYSADFLEGNTNVLWTEPSVN